MFLNCCCIQSHLAQLDLSPSIPLQRELSIGCTFEKCVEKKAKSKKKKNSLNEAIRKVVWRCYPSFPFFCCCLFILLLHAPHLSFTGK